MRKIKFRTWNTIQNEWYIGPYEYLWWGSEFIELKQDCLIFCEYTGLKDKNGVEIYENDIVEYRGKSGVVFMRLGCWFVEHQRELGYYNNSVEIIGNEYENPELLI